MRKEAIIPALLRCGIYIALLVMREEQELENYENCLLIKNAIEEISSQVGLEVITFVDDDSLDTFYKKMKKQSNLTEIFDNNLPYYISDFKDIVKN